MTWLANIARVLLYLLLICATLLVGTHFLMNFEAWWGRRRHRRETTRDQKKKPKGAGSGKSDAA